MSFTPNSRFNQDQLDDLRVETLAGRAHDACAVPQSRSARRSTSRDSSRATTTCAMQAQPIDLRDRTRACDPPRPNPRE